MTYGTTARAFLSVSRANLLVASIGHATIGLLLGAGYIQSLFCVCVPLYIALHYSIAFMACNLNSLSDYDVDKRYKRYLSGGVDVIGKRGLIRMVIAEFFISCALITYFLFAGYYITSAAAVLAMIAAISYSLGPLRIKKRGFWSPFPVMIGLYVLPILGGWFLFQTSLPPYFIIFMIGYALLNEGITLVNTVEDHSEDEKEKIRTWSHLFGKRNTLRIAAAFSVMGLGTVSSLFYNFTNISIVSIGLLFLSTLAILFVIKQVNDVRKTDDPEKSAKIHAKKMPKWFMMTRFPLIFLAISLLF